VVTCRPVSGQIISSRSTRWRFIGTSPVFGMRYSVIETIL
jgi:hypothetical protein